MAALPMVLMGIGTGLQAFGQIQQGYAAEAAGNANADLAMQEGRAKREQAKNEALKVSREKNAMLAEQKAAYGAAGLDPSSGTPLDVIARTATEYERDMGFAGLRGDQEMLNAENQAEIYRWQGKQAKAAGWLGAGSTLLSGIGKSLHMGGYGKGGTK